MLDPYSTQPICEVCGVLCPNLGSTEKERHGYTGQSPVKGMKMRKGFENLLYKENVTDGTVQAGEVEAQGDLLNVCK